MDIHAHAYHTSVQRQQPTMEATSSSNDCLQAEAGSCEKNFRILNKLISIVEKAEAMMESLENGKMMSKSFQEGTEENLLTSHIELEARLGFWNTDKKCFQAGVDRHFMERALGMLTSFDAWSRVTPWSEIQDFYYKDLSGQDLRTTVLYHDQEKKVCKIHLIKKTFDRHTVLVEGTDHPDIRISLSLEQEVDSELIPQIVQTEHVRIKQRKSFYYTPCGFSEPMWVFDMTLSWSGSCKAEAEKKQYSEAPIYEIECECLSPSAYRFYKQERRLFVVRSLLLKLLDFYYPPTDPPSTPNAETLLETISLAS